MAMNKNEKQLMEDLKTIVSFRWSDEYLPDVEPPSNGEIGSRLTKGFLFNSHSKRIEKSCSSSIRHSFGNDEKTTTQGVRWLFSSKLLALKAMRHEVALKSAKELYKIDTLIEKELEGDK